MNIIPSILPRAVAATVILASMVVYGQNTASSSVGGTPAAKSQAASASSGPVVNLKPITVVAHVPAQPQHMDTARQITVPTLPGMTGPWPIPGNPRAEARAEYENTRAYHDGPWSPAAQLK